VGSGKVNVEKKKCWITLNQEVEENNCFPPAKRTTGGLESCQWGPSPQKALMQKVGERGGKGIVFIPHQLRRSAAGWGRGKSPGEKLTAGCDVESSSGGTGLPTCILGETEGTKRRGAVSTLASIGIQSQGGKGQGRLWV